MHYSNLLKELNGASLFDLYRLQVAIGNELRNPHRVIAIKQKLRIGMELSYFNSIENRLAKAKLLELRQKNVLALDFEQQKKFLIPYCALNVDAAEIAIPENSDTLTQNNLKVGDYIGFNNKIGETVVGTIKRLNGKTVTLVTPSGEQWRVAYAYLYRIHEAEIVMEKLSKQNIHGDWDE